MKEAETSRLLDRLRSLPTAKRRFLEQRLVERGIEVGELGILPRLGPRDTFPMSHTQERLWFLHRLEPESRDYHISSFHELPGEIDVRALTRALGEIVQRHEILRTGFESRDGELRQRVYERRDFGLPLIDLAALAPRTREAEARRIRALQREQTFDLEHDSLLRLALVCLDEEDHVLVLAIHHIISDAWSLAIFHRELTALYEAFTADHDSPLGELPIQYGDFVHWQRTYQQSKVEGQQLAYWRRRLEGAPPLLELPTDRPRPRFHSSLGGAAEVTLGADVLAPLKALCRQHGATLFMALLAVYKVLLLRISGQEDLSVGSPIAGRDREELEDLIGFFANTIVLRTEMAGNLSFRELLVKVRREVLAAQEHQQLSFARLVEVLQPERSLSHTPLFQVSFATVTTPEYVGSETWNRFDEPSSSALFDLHLELLERASGEVTGWLYYKRVLFDATTARRFVRSYTTLCRRVAENLDLGVSDLPMMVRAERQQVFVEWGDSRPAVEPLQGCLHRRFEARAADEPDRIALCFGERAMSYGELDRRAGWLARELRTLGVGTDVLVGLFAEHRPETVLGILTILKAGGAYLPLDPHTPRQRLAWMLDDSRALLVLACKSALPDLPESRARVVAIDEERRGSLLRDPEPRAGAKGEDRLAYVIYTSGSTGRPKGVGVAHRQATRLFDVTRSVCYFGRDDAWTLFHSCAFDFSVWEIWGALLHGGRLVIVPYWVGRSPPEFLRLLVDERVTMLSQTPSALQQLTECGAAEQLPAAARIVLGGEAAVMERLRPWLGTSNGSRGQRAPGFPRLINMYGITETTVHVTEKSLLPGDLEKGLGSPLGRPLADLKVHLTSSRLHGVPIGVAGEIVVGGAGVSRGYLGRPALTAERFVPDFTSTRPGERLYRSGDLARQGVRGELVYLGRIDHQVQVRGFRVEPGEIEEVLSGHPEVREAAVVADRDPAGDPRLVAYVVRRRGEIMEDLRAYLAERLPGYMVPAAFVLLPALPVTVNGKLDRGALPAPESDRSGTERGLAEVLTPIEEILAGIWADLLGAERVGRAEDFFHLGGHSLHATRLLSRIRKIFKVDLELREFFANPTVAFLAESIETGSQPPEELPLERLDRTGPVSLSFAQERLWVLYHLAPESPAFNIFLSYRLAGPLDLAVLAASFDELARRHETLRTTFTTVDGAPCQVVAPPGPVPVPVVDLAALAPTDREDQLEGLAEAEMAGPFELERGPLWRARLLLLGKDRQALLGAMHHIISDGWSLRVLIRDLAALYQAFLARGPSLLAPLPVQYADYGIWQRQWLVGERLEEQLVYWRERLAGELPVLKLPMRGPRPAKLRFLGDVEHRALPQAVAEALLEIGRREGATLFMTLLAAFKAMLYRSTGQIDLIVGTNVANRQRTEIEGLIGFFVNNLVLRTEIPEHSSFRQLLNQVRETALGAYAHQDVPYELLLEELGVRRSARHAPIFQILFLLEDFSGAVADLPKLALAPLSVRRRTANFDLTLAVVRDLHGLQITLIYDTDLFEAAAMSRMMDQFSNVLRQVVADPERILSELSITEEAEEVELIDAFNVEL